MRGTPHLNFFTSLLDSLGLVVFLVLQEVLVVVVEPFSVDVFCYANNRSPAREELRDDTRSRSLHFLICLVREHLFARSDAMRVHRLVTLHDGGLIAPCIR